MNLQTKAKAISLYRQNAHEAWHRRDYAGHFRLMHQAEQLGPTDPAVLLDLGTAYGHRTEFEEALSYLEKAVACSRDKVRVLGIAGSRCRDFLRYDLAAGFFERASQAPGASPETWATLAEMKERLRETASAQAAVDRALHSDPQCQPALLVQARLQRIDGRLAEAEETVRALLKKTDRSGAYTRCRGWYELALILDGMGRYDEAFAALVAGKELTIANEGSGGTLARLAVYRGLEVASRELTPQHFKKWSAFDPRPDPRRLTLIGGHPRSGTTLLEQILDAHSKVVSAEETEIFFETYYEMGGNYSLSMPALLESLSETTILEARKKYFRRMSQFVSGYTPDKILIDKNPALTSLIPGMLRLFPQLEVIIALRDPRDVCVSCFMQHLISRYLTLEQTVDEYCAMMSFWLVIRNQLATPYLEIRYEDVVSHTSRETERTLQFLGLDWEPTLLDFTTRAQKKLVRSPTYTEVTRPVTPKSVGRWKNYRKYLEPHLSRLEPFVKAFGYDPS